MKPIPNVSALWPLPMGSFLIVEYIDWHRYIHLLFCPWATIGDDIHLNAMQLKAREQSFLPESSGSWTKQPASNFSSSSHKFLHGIQMNSVPYRHMSIIWCEPSLLGVIARGHDNVCCQWPHHTNHKITCCPHFFFFFNFVVHIYCCAALTFAFCSHLCISCP